MNNLQAFNNMVGISELGQDLINVSDGGYNVLVGSTAEEPLLFNDYSKHPHVYNHKYNSTAAGKFQYIFSTWEHYRIKLDLPDFSPASQDLAFAEDIKDHGALDDVNSGDIVTAITKCSNEWASLPGGNSGQHEQHLDFLIKSYQDAGGILTSTAS